jgi:hypothetical protein
MNGKGRQKDVAMAIIEQFPGGTPKIKEDFSWGSQSLA